MTQEHHIQVHRTARYFTLGNSDAPAEVWFVLHGYGQLAERFLARFAPADDGRRLIVAPEGLSRFYVQGSGLEPDSRVGASWMTREDRLREIEDYIGYLDAVHREVVGRPKAGGAKLGVLGFSQGTATAARWAVRGKARPDRLVLWAGLLPPEIALQTGAARLSALDLTLVVGRHDDPVVARLPEQEAALERAGVRYRVIRFDGGHEIEAKTLGEVMR